MASLITELKRRNVIRVGVAYVVIAWLLAQVAELALDSFEAPGWVIKTILLVLALGFPLALFFAWAFELTPEGIKKEKDVDRTDSITHKTGRKLDFVIIGVLAVAVGLLLFDKFAPEATDGETNVQAESSAETTTAKSIAVLPFVDMSADKDQEYFSDGIAEELLNVLVRIKGIKVASRTSSFAFKGKDVGIPQIASELKVNHILEGSVRKAGERVRVTAQLIDVKSDRHLWSDTYDRDLSDIFAIQDEIAGEIVEALQIALGTAEQAALAHPVKATDNLEAYELYLRGRSLWQRRGENNIQNAIKLFEEATQLDPKFARGWSALAAAHLTMPAYSTSASRNFHWAQAGVFANKALALDDGIAETYAVLADLSRNKAKWQEAESHYKKALALEPGSSTAHLWYAEFLADVGRVQDALAHSTITLEVDPLSPGANVNAAELHRLLGDFEQAIKYSKAASDLGHQGASSPMIESYISLGDFDQAKRMAAQFEESMGIPADQKLYVDYIEAMQNPAKRADLFRRMDAADYLSEDVIEHTYVALGSLDDAFAHIPRQRTHWMNTLWYLWDVKYAGLRQDPRFKDVVREAGLVDYWRNNTWADYCHPKGDDFYCE